MHIGRNFEVRPLGGCFTDDRARARHAIVSIESHR
jgi:hypothetical protein